MKRKTARSILCLYLSLMMVISTFLPVFADAEIPVVPEPKAAISAPDTESTLDPPATELPVTDTPYPGAEEPVISQNPEVTTPSFVNPEIIPPVIPEPDADSPSFFQFGTVEKALEENAQFLPNTGQMNENVNWYSNFGAGSVFVEKNGTLTYLLMENNKDDIDNSESILTDENGLINDEGELKEPQKGWVLKEQFIGADDKAVVTGKTRGSGKFNFLLGNDKKKHKKDVSGYKELTVTKLYPEIDLLLSHKGETIEKTFELNPGADPTAIKIQMDGAQKLSVDGKGNLVVGTGLGNVLFSAPKAWQGKNGKELVDVRYWTDGTQYGFTLGAYDAKHPLYIDPEIVSTYFGGNAYYTYIRDITVSSEGDVYATGSCYSTAFPTTVGAYDVTSNGYYDGFVTKFDNDLSEVLASTYIGGTGNYEDYGREILTSSDGRVYVALETKSSTFPIVGTPYDSSHNGDIDIAIVCMDSELSTLEYSTFIGGSFAEYVYEMLQNSYGEIVIAGYTMYTTTNYPTTAGSYQPTHGYGSDSFVSIFSADLSTLTASTLFGGRSSDDVHCMAISSSGDIYIAGLTQGTHVTAGAYDTTFNGGTMDVFVARFNDSLTTLKSSTYIGGSTSYEWADAITIMSDGSVAVAGMTNSSDFPVTMQAYDTVHNGIYDGFISVLNYDLTELQASTFIGGTGNDCLYDLKSDTVGMLYAIGETNSDGFPVTPDALDSIRNSTDGVIIKIDDSLENLKYSTFLGGNYSDSAKALVITDDGTLFVSGTTNSSDFPVTVGALQTTNSSAGISFILKTPRDLTGLAAADWVRLEGIQPPGLNPGYGGYTFDQSVLKVTGARPLDFRVGYNSILLKEGPVGQGWNHNFEAKLIKAASGNVEIDWNQNRISRFNKMGDGTYQPNDRYNPYEHLTEDAGGSYTLTDRSGETYLFNTAGKLTGQRNRIGQTLSMTYNASNQLETITEDVSGRALTLDYNANGLLASVTDLLNRQATFAYDGTNRLITYTNAAGYETHYTYNDAGQILTVTNDTGETLLENTYDAPGRVTVIEDNLDDGKSTTIDYNVDVNANTVTSTITDRNGKDSVVVYNAFYELKQATDALNNATEFTYDSKGNITAATEANGHITHFTWDAEGNMTHAFDAEGHETTFTYDNQHNILSAENALDKISEFTYDSNNNLTEYQDRLNNATAYTYGSGSVLTQVIKPRGGVTAVTNQSGQAVTITPNGGSASTLGYDGAGRLISVTDGAGKTTSYTYDDMDRLLSITDSLSHTTSYTYDCDENRLTQTDPRNNTTHYTYDENNRLTQVTDALDHSTSFAYDAEGLLVSKTDALNHTTQYAYDDNGRLITETDPLNHATTYSYDEVGNLEHQNDGLNNTVFSGTYDEVGNLLTATDALSNTAQNTYDLLNRLTSVTDPLSRITCFGYDDLDRLVQGTDAQNGQSSIGYDTDGNRNTLTDQNSQQTGFAFDLGGRLTTVTSAAGNTKAYQYNSRELVSQVTNGRQQAANITYDDASRITSITDPAGTISYTYDNAGNILTISDSNGTLTRQYDALGRITQYTDGNSNTIGYSYDAVGRLTTLTYPGGRQVTYGYDAANRLTTVTDWASRQTQYSYDSNNRLTGITRPDGSHQTNTYDAKGQLTTAEDRDSQSALISRYEYTYDSVGNITTETSTTGQGHVETNTFSAVDRITTQAVTENGIPTEQYGYTYDAGGNILIATNSGATTTFTNGNANRIATVNGQTVTYDADGNITSAPLNGTPSTFAFDCRNRLTSVGNSSYTYNAENQRIGITENGVSTNYVINPNATLSQTLIKNSGGVSTYYVYGLGLIGEQTGTDYKTYHYDLRGSTIALTDSAGLMTDTFNYAPYGELLSRTGTSDVDYLYNGRDGVIADDNGLYQMRARYYDPELRRFLNEDGYAEKYDDILNVNLYAYCEGNPVGFVDPSGFDKYRNDHMNEAKGLAAQYMNDPKTQHVYWVTNAAFLAVAASAAYIASAPVIISAAPKAEQIIEESMPASNKADAFVKSGSIAEKPVIKNVASGVKKWIGDGAKVIKNKSGDTVFVSKDGLKRVRFDINNPSPHANPHGHVEELINGKWVKSGPIYPTDAPHN